jgi:type IV pilus assembly protein PilW
MDIRQPTPTRQTGFTLVELMVGIALALITTVIVAQVMWAAEGSRRTTTQGSDAQVNGALALYTIQRDLQMAGYGVVNNPDLLGCEVRGQYDSHAARSFTLAPVIITSGGAANASDSITVLRSGSTRAALPVVTTSNHTSTSTSFEVQSTVGVAVGDLILAMPQTPSATNWCTLFQVRTDATNQLTGTTIPHLAAANTWNPTTSIMPSSYAAGTTLSNVSRLVNRRYEINATSDLQSVDLITAADVPTTDTVASQIVLLKAYYGKDTDSDGVVDSYDQTTPTDNAGWRQVRTVRMAVVARSAQREKDEVTTADPLWDVGQTVPVTGTADCGESQCLTLQVSVDDDTEWRHYRYKVFDIVIPLRNMLWAN